MRAGANPKPRAQLKKTRTFTYEVEEAVLLPTVSKNIKSSFFEVIDTRRSEKQFSPLTLKQISNLLWHSAKVKSVSTSKGIILSHRNTPSAGSIHPIDVFISLPTKLNERSLYYYNPFVHTLSKLKTNSKSMQSFFQIVNANINLKDSTVIWFGADFQRTEAKYKNSESLVWRDSGAFIMLFQLVATALKIRSCPVGTLGNPYFSKLFLKKNNLVSAGGMLIG